MSTTQNNVDWIKSSNIIENIGQPLYNQSGQVILPIYQGLKLSSISRFDPNRDECVEIWKLDKPIMSIIGHNAFAVDVENDILYTSDGACVFTFNLTKDKPNMKEISIGWVQKYSEPEDTRCLIINNQLHIFEFNDEEDITHSIYDIKTGKYHENTIKNSSYWDFDRNSMVHIASQNKLLFIGPYMEGAVISYNLNNQKLKANGTLHLSHQNIRKVTSILTNDEKYMIIFYFYFYLVASKSKKKRKKKDRIYQSKIEIIDIENNVSWISNVKIPFKHHLRKDSYFTFILGNLGESNMIINGYVKHCWRNKEFSSMNKFPVELVGVIIKFYYITDVHLIRSSTGEHWRIHLDDILRPIDVEQL